MLLNISSKVEIYDDTKKKVSEELSIDINAEATSKNEL